MDDIILNWDWDESFDAWGYIVRDVFIVSVVIPPSFKGIVYIVSN